MNSTIPPREALRDHIRNFLTVASGCLARLYASRPDAPSVTSLRLSCDLAGPRAEFPDWAAEDPDCAAALEPIVEASSALMSGLPEDCLPFSLEFSGEHAVRPKGGPDFCKPISISIYGSHPENLRPEELLAGSSRHNRLIGAMSLISGSVPAGEPLSRWDVTSGGSSVEILAPDERSAILRSLVGHLTIEEITSSLSEGGSDVLDEMASRRTAVRREDASLDIFENA